jgi:hypothetical protein
VANVNRDTKKHSEPFDPSEFMPHFDKEEVEGARDKQKKSMDMLAMMQFWMPPPPDEDPMVSSDYDEDEDGDYETEV